MVARVTATMFALLFALSVAIPSGDSRVVASSTDRIARGKELVWSVGCNDCHTPKKMTAQGPVLDEERLLSGHREDVVMPSAPALPPGPWGIVTSHELTAWSGPWGVTYARNLTPDENTGLGIWTEEMFIQALRTGRHMGVSRPIQPPMPWQVYGRMSDEDLKSIYAYLRSIRPVHNRVPEPKLADPELAAWSAN